MTTKNDITGALIKTGVTTDAYRDNYDAIFMKSDTIQTPELPVKLVSSLTYDGITDKFTLEIDGPKFRQDYLFEPFDDITSAKIGKEILKSIDELITVKVSLDD